MKREIKGIYIIERVVELPDETRKYYIGQSIDIFNRFNQHCTERNPGIDEAIDNLGVESFSFRILEKVESSNVLNDCESKWIKDYRGKYGDEQMYNIAQTKNERKQIDPQIKKKIKSLFNEDLARSIYAIAECFNISYEDVVKIRKPLLFKQGMVWKDGKIVYKATGLKPENWKGGQITKNMADKIRTMLKDPNFSIKDIRFVSKSDLNIFLESGDEYDYAQDLSVSS